MLVHQQIPVVVEELIAGIQRRYAEHSCLVGGGTKRR